MSPPEGKSRYGPSGRARRRSTLPGIGSSERCADVAGDLVVSERPPLIAHAHRYRVCEVTTVHQSCTAVLARPIQLASWTSCAAVRPPRSAACQACGNLRVSTHCAAAAVFLDTGSCAGGCCDDCCCCCWAAAAAACQMGRVDGGCAMLLLPRGRLEPHCQHACLGAGTVCRTGMRLGLDAALLLAACCCLSTMLMDMSAGPGARYRLIGRRVGKQRPRSCQLLLQSHCWCCTTRAALLPRSTASAGCATWHGAAPCSG